MCDEKNCFGLQVLPDCTVEDVVSNMGIQGTQGVIEDENALVAVQRSGKADPLALPPTQVGASVTNLNKTCLVRLFVWPSVKAR